MFSDVSPEGRVSADPPRRAIRALVQVVARSGRRGAGLVLTAAVRFQ
jgi:hypothetical protein